MSRALAAAILVLAFVRGLRPRDGPLERTRASRRNCHRRPSRRLAGPAVAPRLGEVRRHRRQRPRLGAAARSGAPDGRLPRALSLRLRADGRRQHLRRPGDARGLPREVRGALCGAARRRRPLLRRARQPRRSGAAALPAVQHARPPLLHVHAAGLARGRPGDRRPGLRHRQHASRRRAGVVAVARARRIEGAVEDPVTAPSALHVGAVSHGGPDHPLAAGVTAGRAWRGRRLLGTRAHLSAQPPPAGRAVLHHRRRRLAAPR